MENEDMLKHQAPSQPIDKTIIQGLVGYLQRILEQLEATKTDIMNIQLKQGMTTPYSNGVIEGLSYAINLLNNNIERLYNK